MSEFVEIILRTGIALISLSIMTMLLGVKHISQMTTFDYIVSIVIGSVGGALCIDVGIPIWQCVLSMVMLVLFAWFLAFINRKTLFARRLFTGTPTVLIDRGEILYNGLKHVKFNINDLLRELRHQGYFNISDVEHAIMEANGLVSILPKSEVRPLTPKDMNFKIAESSLVANVIIDGKIIFGNLEAMNKTELWLKTELSAQEVALDRVLLGTLNNQGEFCLYEKNKNKQKHTIVE
jgi:uncharacterized membrane protein YcaP (DUF421 family)